VCVCLCRVISMCAPQCGTSHRAAVRDVAIILLVANIGIGQQRCTGSDGCATQAHHIASICECVAVLSLWLTALLCCDHVCSISFAHAHS
jgi:hypothetical protein